MEVCLLTSSSMTDVLCSSPNLLNSRPQFCSKKMTDPTIGDAKGAAPNSVQTAGTTSTDSIVSRSTTSSFRSDLLKRKTPSVSSSSSSSLASETDGEEPPSKKMRVPLFKKKLKITMGAVAQKYLESKESPAESSADDESQHCRFQKQDKANDQQRAIMINKGQQLFTLAMQRKAQAQKNLSLTQLKQQAREKARANNPKKRVQPKRKKRKNGKRNQNPKPKSPTSNSNESEPTEPMDRIEMNTGVLFLYRGDNPRAKFVRRK